MILDSQEQKELLLQIFNSVNIPASQIEILYELKKALEKAEISGIKKKEREN
ncbi:MAG: hypothetical protein DDT19_02892 [Syntrophomonadaceae bacterium]|nr:hypothetical protein [Bacillota bacterium]